MTHSVPSVVAIILVGGFGTRLRPLTLRTPKALLPIFNVPFLSYQLALLKKAGVRNVVFALGHHAASLRNSLLHLRPANMKFHFAIEKTPLGTGGGIRNAFGIVEKIGGKEPRVMVFNGDILFDINIGDFIRSHVRAGAACSIAMTKTNEPSRYGVIQTGTHRRIRAFLEKPRHIRGTAWINAGAYLFESALLRRIPAERAVSIERESFPGFLKLGIRMIGYPLKGYWNDIGTPESYLQAHLDLAGRRFGGMPPKMAGRVVRRAGARICLGEASRIGRNVRCKGVVTIGPSVHVGDDCQLEDLVVLRGSRIGQGASVRGGIIGQNVRIGSHAVIRPGHVIGDGAVIPDYSRS